MASMCQDPFSSEQEDLFDRLPDSILLLIFNKIGDVKALGCCCVVSRRFHLLVPQVDTVLIRIDCVISDDEHILPISRNSDKSRSPSSFLRSLIKPFIVLGLLLGVPRVFKQSPPDEIPNSSVTHQSPSQVLKNFTEIKSVHIELPSGELGVNEGALLKWRASFGTSLNSCAVLGASSVSTDAETEGEDTGVIPESWYTNGGLKMRVVWTVSSLIAASARHYLVEPIVAKHGRLECLVLNDAAGQGVLRMGKEDLEELRGKPLAASSSARRTVVPPLTMRLWYSPELMLEGGVVLKGATLVAIRRSDSESSDTSWVNGMFEEPYDSAVRSLLRRRTYYLEMNSF